MAGSRLLSLPNDIKALKTTDIRLKVAQERLNNLVCCMSKSFRGKGPFEAANSDRLLEHNLREVSGSEYGI